MQELQIYAATSLAFDISMVGENGQKLQAEVQMRDSAWHVNRDGAVTWLAAGKLHWADALAKALKRLEAESRP